MAKAWLEKQETKLSDNEKKLEGISQFANVLPYHKNLVPFLTLYLTTRLFLAFLQNQATKTNNLTTSVGPIMQAFSNGVLPFTPLPFNSMVNSNCFSTQIKEEFELKSARKQKQKALQSSLIGNFILDTNSKESLFEGGEQCNAEIFCRRFGQQTTTKSGGTLIKRHPFETLCLKRPIKGHNHTFSITESLQKKSPFLI